VLQFQQKLALAYDKIFYPHSGIRKARENNK